MHYELTNLSANPVGGALGQLISPIAGDARQSVLILGIICTVIALLVFLVQSAPPTPPSLYWHAVYRDLYN